MQARRPRSPAGFRGMTALNRPTRAIDAPSLLKFPAAIALLPRLQRAETEMRTKRGCIMNEGVTLSKICHHAVALLRH